MIAGTKMEPRMQASLDSDWNLLDPSLPNCLPASNKILIDHFDR